MPRKVKTRRQRKRAAIQKKVAKGEQTSPPEEKSGNLEGRVNIEETPAKHINRPQLVSPSGEKKEKIIDKLVKKKAAHQRGGNPKATENVGELGNALDKDKEQYSSSVSLGDIDENELLDQIWKDLDEIFPDNTEGVTKSGLSPNVDWVNQPANLKSSYKLIKKKAAYHRGRTSRGTRNARKLGNGLDNDKKQYSKSDFKKDLDEIIEELNELFPPDKEAVVKGTMSPDVEESGNLGSSYIMDRKLAKHFKQPTLLFPTKDDKEKAIATLKNLTMELVAHKRSGSPIRTCNVCDLGLALNKGEEQYSTSNLLNVINEVELDQIWKDLHDIFPSSEEAVAKVEEEKKSANLESKILIDSSLANGPLVVSPVEEKKDEATEKLIKKKAAHHCNRTPKGTRNACGLRNGYSRNFQKQTSSFNTNDKAGLDQIWQHMQETYPHSDKTVPKVGFYPNMDCSTHGGLVGDSGPVPPKFFGNSGYFMLTGTNSQLQQQMKDLAARNIFVESFVELPDAMADIVEQQMTDLVQSRNANLGKMREPRRVPRQKKQRKCPKKTDHKNNIA